MSIYSCGWCLLPDMMVHGGHFPGFANYFSVDTAYRQTIVLLSNNWYPLLYVTTKTIHNILHHDSHAIDWIRNESSQDINDYTGTYSLDDISVEFKVEPTGLVSLFSGKKQFLKQFANDEFFLTDFGGNIRFNRDKNNKIISVSSFENYRWVELKKVN
jgi:hypothetical protein